MTARAQLRRAPSPPMWWSALLVFGLLVGLFGMHGLTPGGSAVVGGHHSSVAVTHADMPGMGGMGDDSVCRSDSGDGGHARHADVTCASGALGAGPVLPALLPARIGPAAAPVGGHRSGAAGQESGRAPPSLAELQLLRI